MTQREKDISFIKSMLGDSFRQGKKIVSNGYCRYGVVELQDGREVKISLPNVSVADYKIEPKGDWND